MGVLVFGMVSLKEELLLYRSSTQLNHRLYLSQHFRVQVSTVLLAVQPAALATASKGQQTSPGMCVGVSVPGGELGDETQEN